VAIAPHDSLITALCRPGWRDYLELTKPKVSLLIVFTAIVGMILASPGMVPLPALVFGTLGIAMASGSAATLNHILDRRIDQQMARTRRRPLATGSLRTSQALVFAGALCVGSMTVLSLSVGSLCAVLTFGSVIGYAVIYTGWLKHATPQNIVIGGAAGAAPPVLGWVAVTHSIDAQAYTVLLILCTLIPVVIGMSGLIYLAAALLLDARFLYLALALHRGARPELPIRTFRFSITYLMALFGAFIADHCCRLLF
jgi:heme o synthase